MIFSVVTGTFNRLSHLKTMMDSITNYLPKNWQPGLDYEFCVCDGGSTDGTIEWLEQKPGVTLVKHGALHGAIKAFNDAAAAAKGDYLLIANDDVEIKKWSVTKAIAYIMDNRDVGCVCFYQDRNGKEMHVETMPIYKSGSEEPISLPYMQVGVIPRFLWEKCGGWGDGAWGSKTYGGDNYITMRVYESGYKVIAIPECAIHDKTVDDELRQNNYAKELSSHASGSVGFWGMFPRIEMSEAPLFENSLPEKRRILYVPIIEQHHVVQKHQKCGLRQALETRGIVWEVDYIYSREHIADAAEAWNPHMTLTQFHDERAITKEDAGRLKRATKGHLVNWVGDVWPDQQLTPNFMDMLRLFDYQLVVNASLLKKYAEVGINAAYWQNSFEPQVPGDIGAELAIPEFDVVFLGNNYSSYRADMAKTIAAWPNAAVYGRGYDADKSFPEGFAKGESLYDYRKTGQIYRNSKLIIADNQYPEATGFASDRLFMALASGGGMLLHQKVEGMEEHMGLVDGLHYVSWTTMEDLKEKIEYWLAHDEERRYIARMGTAECLANHSYLSRVEQLWDMLSKLKPRKTVLSACIIVKNEEKNIDRVLSQLDACMGEIVVVDTGSSDKTVEKIKEFEGRIPPRLFYFKDGVGGVDAPFSTDEWLTDFSEARNYAKSKCCGDYIFWMDGDDLLSEELVKQLARFDEWKAHKKESPNPIAFRFPCVDGQQSAKQIRLFRNLHGIKWEGMLHEMVDMSVKAIGGSVVVYRSLAIYHNGGDEAKRQRRHERNMLILEGAPESWTKWHYIAQSYANVQRFADAYLYAEKAASCDDVPDEYRDWLRYLCGEFCFLFGDKERAKFIFKTSAFPDALFRMATMEIESGKLDYSLLKRFMLSPDPVETPSARDAFMPIAKEAAIAWLDHERAVVEGI